MRKIYENERCGCSTLEASYSCLLGGLLSLESFFCIYIYDKSLTNQPTFARNGPLATRSIENGMPHTDVFGSSPFECARDAMTPSSRIGDFWRMSINGSHGTWRPFDDAQSTCYLDRAHSHSQYQFCVTYLLVSAQMANNHCTICTSVSTLLYIQYISTPIDIHVASICRLLTYICA